ncbi:MAG: hypothetical protein ACLR23_15600 [Clostridia bacterium]
MLKLGSRSAEAAMEIVEMENEGHGQEHSRKSSAEPSSIWYSIYGNKGMAESNRWEEGVNVVNLYEAETDKRTVYKPGAATASKLAERILGHGGSDFYTVHYFIQKILGNPEVRKASAFMRRWI